MEGHIDTQIIEIWFENIFQVKFRRRRRPYDTMELRFWLRIIAWQIPIQDSLNFLKCIEIPAITAE
jgi:hypothetical protein